MALQERPCCRQKKNFNCQSWILRNGNGKITINVKVKNISQLITAFRKYCYL